MHNVSVGARHAVPLQGHTTVKFIYSGTCRTLRASPVRAGREGRNFVPAPYTAQNLTYFARVDPTTLLSGLRSNRMPCPKSRRSPLCPAGAMICASSGRSVRIEDVTVLGGKGDTRLSHTLHQVFVSRFFFREKEKVPEDSPLDYIYFFFREKEKVSKKSRGFAPAPYTARSLKGFARRKLATLAGKNARTIVNAV